MADIDWDDVEDLAPELSAVPSAAKTLFLELANTRVRVDLFGGEDAAMTKMARIYLAAHFGAMHPSSGSAQDAGPIASESLGSASFGYAVNSAEASSNYGSTKYGRMFRQLARMTPARLGTV